jgi:predicted metal-dependent phosphoesterase TrpH
LKADLHVHTAYSRDSLTSFSRLLYWAEERGMDAIAVTDHNTIAAALALRRTAPLQVIVGEEIRTRQGEIIGLFLEHEVAAGLTALETVQRIRAQGGLVVVPHPIDRVRRSALDCGALFEIIEQVDALEVLNARVTFPLDNERAAELACAYRLLRTAGSDAHQGFEIGQAYVEMPPFCDAPSFLESLAQGQVCGSISSPLVHVGSTCAKVAKVLMPVALGGR